MFNKTSLVLAASALVLTACGGGGGGGGSGASLPPPVPAIQCKAGNASAPTGAIALDTSLVDRSSNVTNTAALVAGACLYQGFAQGGGVNQFGGRTAGATSVVDSTDDVACGVYTAGSSTVGTKLATTVAEADAVYCTVVKQRPNSSITSYARHYFKIQPISGFVNSAPVFTVTAYADIFDPGSGTQGLLDPNFGTIPAPRTLQLTLTGTNGAATAYSLKGNLPPTLDTTSGAQTNPGGATALDVAGSLDISADSTLLVSGFEGQARKVSSTNASIALDTFGPGSKLAVTRASGGFVSIRTALQP